MTVRRGSRIREIGKQCFVQLAACYYREEYDVRRFMKRRLVQLSFPMALGHCMLQQVISSSLAVHVSSTADLLLLLSGVVPQQSVQCCEQVCWCYEANKSAGAMRPGRSRTALPAPACPLVKQHQVNCIRLLRWLSQTKPVQAQLKFAYMLDQSTARLTALHRPLRASSVVTVIHTIAHGGFLSALSRTAGKIA